MVRLLMERNAQRPRDPYRDPEVVLDKAGRLRWEPILRSELVRMWTEFNELPEWKAAVLNVASAVALEEMEVAVEVAAQQLRLASDHPAVVELRQLAQSAMRGGWADLVRDVVAHLMCFGFVFFLRTAPGGALYVPMVGRYEVQVATLDDHTLLRLVLLGEQGPQVVLPAHVHQNSPNYPMFSTVGSQRRVHFGSAFQACYAQHQYNHALGQMGLVALRSITHPRVLVQPDVAGQARAMQAVVQSGAAAASAARDMSGSLGSLLGPGAVHAGLGAAAAAAPRDGGPSPHDLDGLATPSAQLASVMSLSDQVLSALQATAAGHAAHKPPQRSTPALVSGTLTPGLFSPLGLDMAAPGAPTSLTPEALALAAGQGRLREGLLESRRALESFVAESVALAGAALAPPAPPEPPSHHLRFGVALGPWDTAPAAPPRAGPSPQAAGQALEGARLNGFLSTPPGMTLAHVVAGSAEPMRLYFEHTERLARTVARLGGMSPADHGGYSHTTRAGVAADSRPQRDTLNMYGATVATIFTRLFLVVHEDLVCVALATHFAELRDHMLRRLLSSVPAFRRWVRRAHPEHLEALEAHLHARGYLPGGGTLSANKALALIALFFEDHALLLPGSTAPRLSATANARAPAAGGSLERRALRASALAAPLPPHHGTDAHRHVRRLACRTPPDAALAGRSPHNQHTPPDSPLWSQAEHSPRGGWHAGAAALGVEDVLAESQADDHSDQDPAGGPRHETGSPCAQEPDDQDQEYDQDQEPDDRDQEPDDRDQEHGHDQEPDDRDQDQEPDQDPRDDGQGEGQDPGGEDHRLPRPLPSHALFSRLMRDLRRRLEASAPVPSTSSPSPLPWTGRLARRAHPRRPRGPTPGSAHTARLREHDSDDDWEWEVWLDSDDDDDWDWGSDGEEGPVATPAPSGPLALLQALFEPNPANYAQMWDALGRRDRRELASLMLNLVHVQLEAPPAVLMSMDTVLDLYEDGYLDHAHLSRLSAAVTGVPASAFRRPPRSLQRQEARRRRRRRSSPYASPQDTLDETDSYLEPEQPDLPADGPLGSHM